MILYRFSHARYANDISGEGARSRGGRWNEKGTPALYTSETISLGLLEVLVNANSIEELQQIHLMMLELPDDTLVEEITTNKLRKNWVNDFDYSQWLGNQVLKSNQVLMFKCPSAVIWQEHNFVLNPLHKDFKKIKLISSSSFYFDPRLFKTSV